jgi:hypothetical protein
MQKLQQQVNKTVNTQPENRLNRYELFWQNKMSDLQTEKGRIGGLYKEALLQNQQLQAINERGP